MNLEIFEYYLSCSAEQLVNWLDCLAILGLEPDLELQAIIALSED